MRRKIGIIDDWNWLPVRSNFYFPAYQGCYWDWCWNWLCFYMLVRVER